MLKVLQPLGRLFGRRHATDAKPELVVSSRAELEAEVKALRQEQDETARYLEMHWDPNLWPSFAALSEKLDDASRPPLDRTDVDVARLTPNQRFWRENGYLILENFLPAQLIDAYAKVREKVAKPGGWDSPTPYEHIAEIRDLSLYPPLLAVLRELIPGEMVLHLNLTGWVSSERDWHQDDYLNPDPISGWYMAAWMALDDVHPDCGPFEFVPGSHRWPVLRRAKVCAHLAPFHRRQHGRAGDHGHWANYSQDFVVRAVEQQIRDTGLQVQPFLAKRGDVLLWHACLAHRGSKPRTKGMPRRSLISHFSEIEHRTDFSRAHQRTHKGGGKYQEFGIPLY